MVDLFKKKEKESGCKSCPSATGKVPFKLPDNMEQQLQEMKKNKAKSIACPYLHECKDKVLPHDFDVLCKDQECGDFQLEAVHMKGKHLWELCKAYYRIKTEKEGKTPQQYIDEGS